MFIPTSGNVTLLQDFVYNAKNSLGRAPIRSLSLSLHRSNYDKFSFDARD